LRLTLAWDGQCILSADLASTRPQAARVLVGQPASKVLELVPRLFSLCGKAQGAAAWLALQAARGEQPDEVVLQDVTRAVVLEAIGEHLWRLLLDWPPLGGQPARKSEFLDWRRRLLAASSPEAAALVGTGLAAWLDEQAPMAVERTERALSAMPGELLPWMLADQWARQPFAESFAERPSFAGSPAETGPLARWAGLADVAVLHASGQGVAARLVARYADLRFLAAALLEPQRLSGWLDAAPLAENVGLARVETARGLLLHLMQVNDGRVGRYVIVAPTEWNFHPQGAFVREITGCLAPSRVAAEAAARRLALALDPCVAYEIVVNEVTGNA
jgi:hypothetical protein